MQKVAILTTCAWIVVFSITSAFAQQEQSGLVKTAKGYLIVWNEPGNYFTMEVRGDKILPSARPRMLMVDGRFFEIQTTKKEQFLNPNDKTLDDKAVLAAHRDWERDYASGLLKAELKVESEWLKLPTGQDALGWSYKMPKGPQSGTVKKQFYLTLVNREHVIVLNSALEGGEEKDTKQLLLQTMLTLKPTDKPLNIQKAAEQVKKGTND